MFLAVASCFSIVLIVRMYSQLLFLSPSVAWKVHSGNSQGMMLVWSG